MFCATVYDGCLQRHRALHTLDLRGGLIGFAGAMALADLMVPVLVVSGCQLTRVLTGSGLDQIE